MPLARRSRLAVIVHADIVGSTKLVQRDERIAHERMQAAFRRFSETIAGYGGTTRELRGDALVAEFQRASDAACAALVFQEDNRSHNDEIADGIRPEVRIGIALGEVVIADRTITGTGVVLAQRLEQLAEGGGVVAQGAVFEAIPRRLPLRYESLGEQQLKGFDEPVRAYRVSRSAESALPPPELSGPPGTAEPARGRDEGARVSVAVLPFENLSHDAGQEFLSDGIAEDLITALSRYRWFFVIARNSSFIYKGRSADVREIGQELGVRYVVGGRVRRAGTRLRITVQLIDSALGTQLWTRRYERELQDIFELQDEICEAIAGELEPELAGAERSRARRASPGTLAAWECYMRGTSHMWHTTAQDSVQALHWFSDAIAAEPRFAPARAARAYHWVQAVTLGFQEPTEEGLRQAMEDAHAAVTLDDRDALCHFALGRVLTMRGSHDLAIRELRRAVELNPSFSLAYLGLSIATVYAGRASEALEPVDRAMRLSPHDSLMATMLLAKGLAHLCLAQYEQATWWFEQSIHRGANYLWPFACLAAAYAHLGRGADAARMLAELRRIAPEASLGGLRRMLGPFDGGYLAVIAGGLESAGLRA